METKKMKSAYSRDYSTIVCFTFKFITIFSFGSLDMSLSTLPLRFLVMYSLLAH